jgi:hypothetical protein
LSKLSRIFNAVAARCDQLATAYFDRIDYSGERAPTLATLESILVRHTEAIGKPERAVTEFLDRSRRLRSLGDVQLIQILKDAEPS